MKKILAFYLLLFASLVQAENPSGNKKLDTVMFQTSAKQWVTTQTALLRVDINATLTNADLVQARSEIMSKLAKIAAADWHLSHFERSQDNSGLEKLSASAEARVAQSSLTDVYQAAKGVSKPGATYQINGIEFKPSLEEIAQVKAQLRTQLYQQVKDELARLNKIYLTQQYSLNRLVFIEGTEFPLEAKAARNNTMMMNAVASASAPGDLGVSNELIMSALVEVASDRGGNKSSAGN